MRVWKSYKIGTGKLIPWEKLKISENAEVPCLTDMEGVTGDFMSVKSKRKEKVPKQKASDDSSEHSSTEELETEEPDVRLFSCPEEGCIKRYQRYSHLQHHLDSGKHALAVEREPLLDRAVLGYAERLEVKQVGVPSVRENVQDVSNEKSIQPLFMGWALRSSQTRRTRFTTKQKDYLTRKFNIGETTGCKADAVVAARDMMTARLGSDGERLFRSDEFLTSQQITSFFSRLAAKKSLPDDRDDNDDDVNEAAAIESALEELGNQVQREIALQHPIVFDCYNICDLVKDDKLQAKFNILMLKKMCEHFEIDVSEITVRLKRPYIDKLSTFCSNCSCRQLGVTL